MRLAIPTAIRTGSCLALAITMSWAPADFQRVSWTSAEAEAAAGQPSFRKVFIVVLENTEAEEALQQPYHVRLKDSGAYLSNFFAVARPSQPNYFAIVSGDTHGAKDDSVDIDARTIADLLEEKGLTWKSYAEDYPGNCFTGSRSTEPGSHYVRKHEPFISFKGVQENSKRCGFIVPATQLQQDIDRAALPTYSLYIPNMLNNAHDTGVKYADEWLRKTFGPRLEPKDSKFMKDLLFVVIYDEGKKGRGARNHVYAALYGDSVIPGTVSDTRYDFYNLLKTIEETLGLGSLTENDRTAEPITGVWR